MHLEYREELRYYVAVLKNLTKVRITFMLTNELDQMNNFVKSKGEEDGV